MSDETVRIDDGGPAFPTQLVPSAVPGRETGGDSGMSIRDYFVGQALVALAAPFAEHSCEHASLGKKSALAAFLEATAAESDIDTHVLVADLCYWLADAMLDRRAEGGGK